MSRRLRETRAALGEANAAEFARKAGLSTNAYSNYENGYRIGLDAAVALCETYHLSLDWIYFGEPSALLSMPSGVADKIRAHLSRPSAQEPSKKSRRPFRKAL